MNIRAIRADEFEPVRQLLANCGWTKKVADAELFARSVRASQIALVAEDDGQILGFLRAISDGIFNGYISMVAVAPAVRHRGIGAALVNTVTESNPAITWVLRADRDGVQDFYKKLGFETSSVAMEKRRK